jgi:hypothetical protein
MTTVGLSISREQAASVSLEPNTGTLTLEERQRVNRNVGASIDRELPKIVSRKLSLHLDAGKLVALTGALKASVRSKLQVALGVTKATGAGQAGASGSASASGGASAGGGISLGAAGGVQGGINLGASLGLRGGGGVTAGAEGTPLAGVKIQAGLDPNGIPGLTAGIKVFDPSAAGVKVSVSRDIRVELDGLLADALSGSGLSIEKQELVKAEVSPKIGEALDDSFRSSFGPSPGYPHASGEILLTTEVTMPRRGEWTAIVGTDPQGIAPEPPTGPFVFEIEGVEWRGTAKPARSGASQGGRMRVSVVGGAGGLAHDLDVRNYGGGVTRAKTVVDDILRDAGETLSAESDSALLATRIEGWQRAAMPGRRALDRICDKIGATWRILRDGTVWIGVDTWPEVEPDGIVQDDDWADGVIFLAPDTPSMVPGIVVRGQRVEEVVHRLSRAGLRTELRATGIRQVMDAALEPVRQEGQYSKRYRCKVVSQGADGRVDVLVDDERMRGRGVAKCAVRVGIPGTTVTALAGARCLVGWDDGDPALPYVSDWESGTAFTQIEIGESPRPVARVGDICQGFFAPGLQISGTIPAGPFTGVITVVTPFTCVIQGGSNALNVGSASG